MKKHLFLAAVAAFALVSCAKDETKSINTGEEISFRSAMQVKATETTTENLTEFNVTAIFTDDNSPYFQNITFTGSSSSFTSTDKYYWPQQPLKFIAYAPTTGVGTPTLNGASVNLQNFTVASSIADQVDLIAATATGNKQDNEGAPVPLTFGHLLSQIEVKAKNDNTTYVFSVSGLRIGQVSSQGTVDLSTTTWSSVAQTVDYEILFDPFDLNSTPTSLMGDEGNAMLIPQSLTAWNPASDPSNANAGAYLGVLIDIDTDQGVNVYPTASSASAWVAVPINTTWEKGSKYVYTLDFSEGAGNVDPEDPDNPGDPILGSAITFSVEVSPWTTSEQNLPMP